MKATDMRSLSRDARLERRVQVIRLRKARYTYEEIETQTGLSRTGVFDICKRHSAAGASALRDARSGHQTGEGRLLEFGQEAVVRKLIADKTPDQLKMADHADAIEVFYLPSYSPELNPDEMANADIKHGVTTRAPARTKLHLVRATARRMRSVQRQPERVRKYFEHKPVRYAA